MESMGASPVFATIVNCLASLCVESQITLMTLQG